MYVVWMHDYFQLATRLTVSHDLVVLDQSPCKAHDQCLIPFKHVLSA